MIRPLFPAVLALLALTLQPVAAQQPGRLTGSVVDAATGDPVGYATVALLRDSTALTAVATDLRGRFEVRVPEAGRYTLTVSMVGYAGHSQAILIPAAGADAGTIRLRPGVEVDDVVVAVQKPLVMSDAEKQTYSVEDDPQASSSTLEEIIRKVPQLSLDGDGNLLLNGQSDYKILVDGRSASTLSRNFKEIMRSMPASQISRIEVITNPSTKYEAEGVGGIINFITQRKRLFRGYSGSLSGGVTVLENPTYYGNATVSVEAGKWAARIMGYGNYHDMDRVPSEQQTWQENFNAENRYNLSSGSRSISWTNAGLNFDLSYQSDTLNLWTLSGWLWSGRSASKAASTRTVEDEAMHEMIRFADRSSTRWDYTGGAAAVNYEHRFGREGHTLTLSDEVEIDPDRGRTTHRYEEDYTYTNRQREHNRVVSNTVQIDYADPIDNHHSIEAGLKHIYRNNRTSLHAANEPAAAEAAAETEFTRMDYRQHILGIYAGYGFRFTKWSGRLGARMERTWNDAEVNDTDHGPYAFANRQFNLVPYASLSLTRVPSHNLSLAYTQRLQRPALDMLSPAENVSSPLEVSYGNPGLEAAVYHTVNLRYGHYAARWSMTLGLNTLLSNNNMAPYSFADAEGVLKTTYSNEVRTRSYGFSGSLSYRPSEKFNLSFSCGGNYAKYDFDAMRIHTGRFSFNQSLNLDFALWKAGRLLMGESFNTGTAALGMRTQHSYYYYFGLKQQFFGKKLDLSIHAGNPFEKYIEHETRSDTPTFRSRSVSRSASRRVGFSVVWRFGKQQVEVKRAARTISNDDIQSSDKSAAGQ